MVEPDAVLGDAGDRAVGGEAADRLGEGLGAAGTDGEDGTVAVILGEAALVRGRGRAGRRVQMVGYAIAAAAPIAGSRALKRMIVDLPGGGWMPPTHASPIPWVLGLMAVMVGGPFVVLAAAGPLLQRWFAGTGHRGGRDPYFLYVASNAGSLAGRLADPPAGGPVLGLARARGARAVAFRGFSIPG